MYGSWRRGVGKPVLTFTFKFYGCVHENNPNHILQRLRKVMSWWDYMDDEYSYENIHQRATNVILNPKLKVLRIIFIKNFHWINKWTVSKKTQCKPIRSLCLQVKILSFQIFLLWHSFEFFCHFSHYSMNIPWIICHLNCSAQEGSRPLWVV